MGQQTNGSTTPRFHYNRLKSVLALRGRSFESLCEALPVHERHAYFVLTNQRRGSVRLLAEIQAQVGDPGWLFITGQTDLLCDEVLPCS